MAQRFALDGNANITPAVGTPDIIATMGDLGTSLSLFIPNPPPADFGPVFQAAIDSLADGAGGTITVPAGVYNIATQINLDHNAITLVGENRAGRPLIQASADVTVFNVTGFHCELVNLLVSGSKTIGTTMPAVILAGVENRMTGCESVFGQFCVRCTGADWQLTDCKLFDALGDTALSLVAGGIANECKIDQNFVNTTPGHGSLSALPPARANTHAYVVGDIVVVGAYRIQCTVAGTSGGAPPTLAIYGTNIIDGGVTWQLLAPVPYFAVICEPNSSAITLSNCDMSGAYDTAILINDSAPPAPQSISIDGCTIGQNFSNGIKIGAVDGISIARCNISDVILNTGSGILVGGVGSVHEVTIGTGNLIFQCQNGISVTAGGDVSIVGNSVAGCPGDAISIAAGLSNWSVTSNNLGGSGSTWGANANGIVVAAGASDHYTITGNNVNTATTPITDGGTGTHKAVQTY